MISVSGINEDTCIWCLSSDPKPTAATGQTKIPNGMLLIQMDTKKVFVYDKENDAWRPF